jgi:general secretion pathway protein D
MWRGTRWATVVLCLVGLLGCAQQRIRDESQDLLRQGQYEQAVRSYEAGLQRYPDSALLRSGLLQARTEAVTRMLTQAAQAQSAGQWEPAEAALQRVLELEPGHVRARAMLDEMATAREQREAVEQVQELLTRGELEQAARRVAVALQGNPRHSELLALQRRIDTQVRQTQAQAAQRGLAERRPISLDFRDAGLRTVLDVVSRNSGINFVLDKDIRPDIRVTAYLREARVEDAIDLITSTHQLAKKVIDERTILVYPNTPEKRREHQEQVVKVFYLASADAKSAAQFLRTMLKLAEPFVDERTNMIAIRESQDNVLLAERLIQLYDTHEAEVLLEVEVLEIRASRMQELGVKFPDSFTLTPLSSASGDTLTVREARNLNSDRIGLSVSGVTVNLKREVGDFNILANPRIRAKSKEKAQVLIGDKVPVITATTGVGGFVSDSVSYLDVGLKLNVEPTVYLDDEVSIRVALEVSSLGTQIRTASGSLAYQIGTRNASTLLRLKDGETQLLAGLISNEDRRSSSRVPGLGDLPVLGRLFSSQLDDGSRTELVLAITPRILRNVRRPSVAETEMWVGTDAAPRLRRMVPQTTARVQAQESANAAPGALPAASPAERVTFETGVADLAASPRPMTLAWSAPDKVKSGDVFVATLSVQSHNALRGLPVQVTFPSDLLEVLEVQEGSFLKQGDASTSFTHQVDAGAGQVSAGALRQQASGATGQGTLISLRLRAKKAGRAEVAVVSVDPIGLADRVPKPELPVPLRVEVE